MTGPARARIARWGLNALIGATIVLGAVALYLLSTATADTATFASHYSALLAVNGALALLLAALVGYRIVALVRRLRAGVFGSRLAARFLLLFAAMAVVPGALVYAVSVQFLARSIESWFDVRVDTALEGGLSLGRTALDNLLRDVVKKTETMAGSLSVRPVSEHVATLNRLREQSAVQEATLFNQRGGIVAFSGNEQAGLLPSLPAPATLRQIRMQQPVGSIESLPGKGLLLRALAPVNVLSLTEDIRVLQVVQPVPLQFARDAELVQQGYRDYQELSLARVGLKRLYGVTLTLALVLALLSALALAFFLAERLASPLGILAQGTDAVARGDFSQRVAVTSRDELGMLSESFNKMTGQLEEARAAADMSRMEVEGARAHLESVLSSLTSGVMSFDGDIRLRSFNPSAETILGLPLAPLLGLPVTEWAGRETALVPFAEAIARAFGSGAAEWEQQVEHGNDARGQVLLVRGSAFAAGKDAGRVVVFDDITNLIQAQRDAAWSEVARRLAHEIKNPLTPIQLSAERLQMKLGDRLAPADAEMLERSTRTIVNQVQALKTMVDRFSQYAKAPGPRLTRLDLNQLVREVLQLYESLSGAIVLELAPGLPPVSGDATQLRQVIHNLLQNAQDALAGVDAPSIRVTTTAGAADIRLAIEDNGSGFPEHLMRRVFEPYVTTKPRGTGLGLVIVKKIVEEHGGQVTVENVAPKGARVTLSIPRMAANDAAAAGGTEPPRAGVAGS